MSPYPVAKGKKQITDHSPKRVQHQIIYIKGPYPGHQLGTLHQKTEGKTQEHHTEKAPEASADHREDCPERYECQNISCQIDKNRLNP